MFIYLVPVIISVQSQWVEKTHSDFADGWEYYYTRGDTSLSWTPTDLRVWKIGAYLWSPICGGLRILQRDLDIDDNGWLDVILTDTPEIDIWWNDNGVFSPLPTILSARPYSSPQKVNVVDLNLDTYEDLLVGVGIYSKTGYIFYGTDNPEIFVRDSVLTPYGVYGCQGITPIDLDCDGYLDLWMPARDTVYILYGPNITYRSPDKILTYPSNYYHRAVFGDVTGDGELDVILGQDNGSEVIITFGPDFVTWQSIPAYEAWDMSLADLNWDGWLDLLVSASSNDYIYWGSESGYSTDNRLTLEGSAEGDCSIEDLNNDGYLDLVIGQVGHGWVPGRSYVRYGPNYSTDFQILEGGSVTIADWNGDGYKDVLMGWFGNGAKLFWNNFGNFDPTDYIIFSSRTDDAVVQDFGNLWDRSNRERYLSSIFNTGDTIGVDSVRWWGNLPSGMGVTMWLRGTLDTTSWNPWVEISNGGTDTSLSNTRYLQYRCVFSMDYKMTSLFSFDSLKVYYSTEIEGNIIVEPDQADSVLPDSTREYMLMVINRTDSLDVINISSSGTIPEWRREIYDSTGTDTLLDTNGDGVPDIDSLFPDDTARILVKITPPSNALYGDTDTTIITGTLAHNPAVRDHATLITTVQRLVSVNIEPSSSDSTQPGETVRYYLWVRNEGNSIDCIDITAKSDWDIDILGPSGEDTLTDTDGDGIQDVGEVSPYESEGLFVDITPPQDVLLGETDTAVVYARSSIDTSVSDSVSLITRVYGDIGVIIEPDISDSTYPQEMIEYQLYITNVGKYLDVVDIETRHTEEWDFSLIDRQGNELCDTDGDGRIDVGSLETGETTVIRFKVTPSSFLPAGLEDTSVIHAISSLDTTRRDSAAIITKIKRIVDIDLETDVSSDSVAPLETIFYPFGVINLGNGDDTVDLSISDASQGWEYVIYEDDIPAEDHNNNTIPDVIVPMYGEEELQLKVTLPLTPAYTEDTVKLTGISSVDTSVRDSLLFITVVKPSPSISIEPDMEGFVYTGETKEYVLTVSCGNIGDSISLSPTPLPDGWVGALYYEGEEMEDINGDGLLDLGYLLPLEERNITFKVTAPELIGYTSDIDIATVVSAYSMLHPPLCDSAVITTQLRIGLDIYNYESPFKERTTFVFSLPHPGDVNLIIYNRVGERVKRLVREEHYNRGIHTEPWEGTNDNGEQVSPGVYIYVFEVTKDDGGTNRLIKKTILQK